ncbi:MAG TPA: AAA family ATPase [Micromonosporaceae bacterium]
MTGSDRLFGRERALAAVRDAWHEALAGRGQLVLVSGEAGIGKTALASQVVREVDAECADTGRVPAAAGAARPVVIRAVCRQGNGSPPYWPWVQVLRGLSRRPAVGAPPTVAASEAARFRLFDAIATYLVRASEAAPLVVVLDDLHWSDEPSLLALSFVADQIRTARVLLLGAYREVEAPPALLDLARGARVVQLGGLDDTDVARLLASVAGTAPDPEFARDVCRRTGGNPFFAREVARLLISTGGLRGRAGDEVPAGVRELLGQRLSMLPPECVDLLGTAAVLGGEFTAEALAAIVGGPVGEVDALLAPAVPAGVLVPASSPGSLRFVHDLFRATAYDSLSPGERARRHRVVGGVLGDRWAAGWPVPAAEVAAHLARAGPDAAAEAVRYAVLAAREAAGRLAYEDAAAHYERALALLSPADDTRGQRVALLLGLGEAYHRSGRPAAARQAYLAAATGARALADSAALGTAALRLHQLGVRAGTMDPQVTGLLDEAAAGLADRPGRLLALLLAARARTLHHAAPAGSVEAVPVADRAVALARTVGDDSTLAACLLAAHDARWRPGSARQRLPIVDEMLGCARRAADRERYTQAQQVRAAILLELGDPRAPAELAEYCRLADGLGYPAGRWNALTRRATLAIVTGRPDEAADLVRRAAALGQRIGEPDAAGTAYTQAFVLWLLGLPIADLAAPRVVYGRRDEPLLVAIGHLVHGDRDAAARSMAGCLVGDLPRSHDPEPLVLAARMFAEFGPDTEREAVYRMLLPLAGTHSVVGGCAAYQGAIDHHLGVLADALGWRDTATRHFSAALSMYERLGATGWAASVRDRAGGEAVFRRDGPTWSLRYDGRAVRVPDSKGLRDLAVLLAVPGREVHVADLLGGKAAGVVATGADPVLDARARSEYRSRLVALEDEIDEAAVAHDPVRASRARAERDFVVRELAAATGLGGRSRRLDDQADRARKTVTARIRYTIDRLRRVHPALAAHLDATVATGVHCRYTPDPPVRWRV